LGPSRNRSVAGHRPGHLETGRKPSRKASRNRHVRVDFRDGFRAGLRGGRSAVVIGVKRTGWIVFQWVRDDVRERDGLIALWGVWTLRGGGRGR